MPSPFEGLLNRRLQRQELSQQQQGLSNQIEARRQAAAEAAQQRQQAADDQMRWRAWMMQNSPRTQLLQQKYSDEQAQNLAYSNYLMTLDPGSVPPEMRGRLAQLKTYLSSNSGVASSGLAKMFLQQAKPRGLQLHQTQTADAEGNPITSYEVFDPMSGGMGPVAPGAMGAGGGPGSVLELRNSLMSRYGLGAPSPGSTPAGGP